jgi:hypothetical protein
VSGKLKYSSNNSGGSWWLKDEDWKNLESAGWEVDWYANQEDRIFSPYKDGRWLGALASVASKDFTTPDEGVAEWERITGQSADDEGCNCCGRPHSFSYEDQSGERRYLDSAPVAYRRSWS